MKIFLSYAREDGQQLTHRLHGDLKKNGFEPWMDQQGGIKVGERFDEKIQIAIDQCYVFLMLLTPGSVRPGGFCRQELTYALENGKGIIPIMGLDCTPPIQITTYHWLDFRSNYTDAFNILLETLHHNNLDITSQEVQIQSVPTNLNSYQIEDSHVIVFYQQSQYKSTAGLYHVAPRIAGHGGHLFGRAAVFEKCAEILRFPFSETLVLQGMGGIGKSSLAAGLAWGLIRYFSGGTVWLDATNSNLVELCDKIGRAYEDEYMTHLPDNEKPFYARKLLNQERTLVVLDNVEERETVLLFQEECDPSNLILTTRNRFASLGRLIELNSLTTEPACALFHSISQLDSSDDPDIQSLVQLLGGHPQALAIAAALCLEDNLTPAELATMLAPAKQRIEVLSLSSGVKNNIWATFDTSYRSLTDYEKQVFRILGGSWSKTATEGLLFLILGSSREGLSSALRGLVRRALISSTTFQNLRIYRTHDLIHVYAQALTQKEEGGLNPLQACWTTGAVTYAQQHAHEDNITHYLYLEAELANLLGAADWATEQKCWSDVDHIALALCAQSDMMSKCGYSRESVHLLERGILAARELGNRQHEALHLGMLGNTYIDLSNYDKAISLLEQAIILSQQLGNEQQASKWTGMIGNAYGDMGNSDNAIEYLSRAIDMAHMEKDTVMEGFWLGWRGNAYRDKGDYDSAKTNLLAAIALLESVNYTLGVTMWRGNYARTLARSGDPATGLIYCKENPSIAEKLGNPRLKSWALLFLSECLHGVGNFTEAYSKAFEGAEIMRKIGDRDGLAEILHNLGAWYLQDNDLESAALYLQEAIALRKSMAHGDLPKTEALLKELKAKQEH